MWEAMSLFPPQRLTHIGYTPVQPLLRPHKLCKSWKSGHLLLRARKLIKEYQLHILILLALLLFLPLHGRSLLRNLANQIIDGI